MVAPCLSGRHHSRRQRSIFFRCGRSRGRRRCRPRATPPGAGGRLLFLRRLIGLGEGESGAAAARRRARVATRQRFAAAGSVCLFPPEIGRGG